MAEEVQLIFQKPASTEQTRMAGIQGAENVTVAKLDQLFDWFKKFKVTSIELWIEGSAKSEGIISLFVSAEGKGGMKITLEPK